MPRDDRPELDPHLADAVRRAYVRPVDEGTAQRHVSAIVAAAGAADEPSVAPRARPPRRRAWQSVLAGAFAACTLPVGLAAAGVDLPDAVQEPYRAVGISLPNQTPAPPAPATQPVAPATTTQPATTPAPATTRPATGATQWPSQSRSKKAPKRRRGKPATTPANPRGAKAPPRGKSTGSRLGPETVPKPRKRAGQRPPTSGQKSAPAAPRKRAKPAAKPKTVTKRKTVTVPLVPAPDATEPARRDPPRKGQG